MALKLSIIVPVYGVEDFLSDCIESLIKQTVTDFELILIDDGSIDRSGLICDEYAHRYSNSNGKYPIIKVIHKKNEGVSVARNVGIEMAQAEYVTFVDSDDWVATDYVETILHEVIGFDLLFFSNYRWLSNEKIIKQCQTGVDCSNLDETEKELLNMKQAFGQYEYFGFTWNKCFCLDIIRKYNIRFVPGLKVREDEVFTNAYCRHITTMRTIEKPIYFYREMMAGLTVKPKTILEWLLLCKSMDETTNGIKNKEFFSFEKNRILSFYFHYITSFTYKEFSDIYSFYHRYFPPLRSHCRKSIFLVAPKWLSFAAYSTYLIFFLSLNKIKK